MSAPTAWARADAAGKRARELGADLALRRTRDPALSRWHPLAIIATGFVAGALFGRIVGRVAAPAATAGFMVPLGAWLQRASIGALGAWWRDRAGPSVHPDEQAVPASAPPESK